MDKQHYQQSTNDAKNDSGLPQDELRILINNLPGDIYWKDRDGRWLGLNAHCLQSLKRMGFLKSGVEAEVLGKTDFDLFGQETAQIYRQNDLNVMEQRIELSIEEITELPTGEQVTLLSTKKPLINHLGEVIGILGNTIDITHIKHIENELKLAKEKAEAANQAKIEFLENMRHDIRTPLSGIVGFAEILKNETKESHTKEYADNLIASSHALLDLMNDVLEAIRVSSGEIPKLKQKFDLRALLRNVIDLNLAMSKAKKLQLNCVVDENLPRYVLGDKKRIHRIVLELIGNALNFTHVGHVTLSADLAKKQDNRLIIRIKVADTGIGIPPEKQQDIYLQFKRLTSSYQGIYKGAGLGLYIVRQFIDELEGEISVKSQLGVGTSFTCILPLCESLLDDDTGVENDFPAYRTPSLLDQDSSSKRELINQSAKKAKILVVEDNLTAQKVIEKILSNLNCDVDLAANGKAALSLNSQNHYDLIFMDIGLGEGADGYEITQQIRNHERDNEHTPIVALTAHAVEENKQRCIEAGMDTVLAKPITKAHAVNILNSFVRTDEHLEREKEKKAKLDLPDTEDELFALEQYPLLEVEQTLKNLGDKVILRNLLKQLVESELPQDLNRMKNSFAKEDFVHVEKLAHKIKGGAVYIGTMRMKYACQYLERYWKTGQRNLFPKLYFQAISVIEDTMFYVKNWLKNN
ncbi:response regulator [Legionella saoudiensis]|uniref:response regulator n=1 Tax=Legionella saoudiensis TaxID=1750561 RepID=UPI00098F6068|nr:response regulator [Legionella saoudiensis]